jgi:hypothetical protein
MSDFETKHGDRSKLTGETMPLSVERFKSADFLQRYARTFSNEMFRLETLRYYGGEDGSVQEFLKGGNPPAYPDDMPWRANIIEKVEQGLLCTRVHLVPEELSDYLRWEIEWAYPQNAGIGEIIKIVRPHDLRELPEGLSHSCLLTQDFQLLDEKTLVFVRYDESGHYKCHERFDDPTLIEEAVKVKRALLELGTQIKN